MTEDNLTEADKLTLLQIARHALEQVVRGEKLTPVRLDSLSPRLRENGASFVTLTIEGKLRGCIGTIEPYRSLAEDVREHAVAAAMEDFRFPDVQTEELTQINIEISCLTTPVPLEYDSPQELISKLRPGIDGVVLRDGTRRATFLPQVWEKISDPTDFMNNLCYKMGAEPELWRNKQLEVSTYKVEEFHE